MTNREYHADPAISKSDLDQIHRSPMHWQYRKAHPPEQTPALLVGSAVHKMILEPSGFADEFVVAPETDRRTKAGREAYQAFQESAAGKTVITPELYRLCTDMAEALHHCQTARQLLTGGKAEQSFFWDDARTGIRCKCRPDYLRDGFCVDYKTTQDASPEAFQKAAYRYRYPVQAYWYLHGLGKMTCPDWTLCLSHRRKNRRMRQPCTMRTSCSYSWDSRRRLRTWKHWRSAEAPASTAVIQRRFCR